MPLWLAARRAASAARPAVQFTLCLPTATALNRELRRTDVVPHRFLFATLAEARALSPTGWRRRHGYKPTCPGLGVPCPPAAARSPGPSSVLGPVTEPPAA
jgi:hypothetical protein